MSFSSSPCPIVKAQMMKQNEITKLLTVFEQWITVGYIVSLIYCFVFWYVPVLQNKMRCSSIQYRWRFHYEDDPTSPLAGPGTVQQRLKRPTRLWWATWNVARIVSVKRLSSSVLLRSSLSCVTTYPLASRECFRIPEHEHLLLPPKIHWNWGRA